ncbi:DUF4232 domain-containing protein [Streptomyces avermitilis]|uniref:DUF4232 domain-containing protein n=1 Tax=Streptomyces avermitilis TaxID=33903 RepID=UPI003403DA84
MRNHRIRTVALAATALVAALSLTACNGSDDPSAASSASSSTGAPAKGTDTNGTATGGTGSTGSTGNKGTGKGGSSSGSADADDSKSSSSSSSSSGGSGDKSGYGQSCGTNDLTWSSRSESQAGGYILVMAKAKAGITCVLSGDLPVVAFGSDGTEASNAEQVAGDPVTLSGSTVAYAGVNPKTTNSDYGKELTSIIVSASNSDPNPVSLKTGAIIVDRPIVTNWHTSATDAVPGDGTDS